MYDLKISLKLEFSQAEEQIIHVKQVCAIIQPTVYGWGPL